MIGVNILTNVNTLRVINFINNSLRRNKAD